MTDPYPVFLPTFLTQPDAVALCAEVGGDDWFPELGGPTARVKALCRRCELEDPCREWGIANDEHGIWGGLSERERRRLRPPLTAPRPINHGTRGGYQTHRDRGEDACADCLRANSLKSSDTRKRAAS